MAQLVQPVPRLHVQVGVAWLVVEPAVVAAALVLDSGPLESLVVSRNDPLHA